MIIALIQMTTRTDTGPPTLSNGGINTLMTVKVNTNNTPATIQTLDAGIVTASIQ
jgi:hypothetical protein